MPDPEPTPELHGLDPGELLARAMNTAQPSPGATVWTPPASEELARLLPQYRIESLLGHGGMGAVYKGWQPTLDRPVAIKLLPAEIAGDADFVARFEREARTLAQLQHPGIVAIHDFGQTAEGHLYFVMEFIDGTDLQKILRGPRLQPDQALEAICQICEALHYAHRQGVIHRDIKPANILFTRDGRAKLADFGLARPTAEDTTGITHTHMVMGTPDYMAPEQRDGQADQRADIYALGVMLYEMLTGQRPHGIFALPSKKAPVDPRLDDVVVKALQQEPADRYQQAGDMKTDVDRIRSTPGQGVPKVAAPPAALRPRPVALAAAILVPVLALGSYLLWKMDRPRAVDVAATAESGAVAVPPATTPSPATPLPATPGQQGPAPIVIASSPPPKTDSASTESSAPTPAPTAQMVSVSSIPAATPTPKHTPATPTPARVVVKSTSIPVAPPPTATPALAPSLLPSFPKQIPNISAWVLAPLEQTVPTDIRQNLTYLREDIADEAKQKPAADRAAYNVGYQLCNTLLAVLDERNQAQVRAGFRGVEANARTGITSQALEARRNYMMSWPQYAREGAQRAELKSQAVNNAQVMKERPKVEWSQRTAQLGKILDTLYAQFRAALRQSPAAK